jgi:predicted metal-dependent enzyme (double-stranded beta helix superfamily)
MGTDALPSPLSNFATELDELRSADVLDLDAVGRLLTDLAADDDFLGPLIDAMPPQKQDVHWLVKPERGPRLVLVHRPEGVMAYTHSHGCWVGIATVRGAETHQHWTVTRQEGNRAELTLRSERVMHRGDVATLVPPQDVHNHGHVVGTGPAPYSLILLGDDMFVFERAEYDPDHGTFHQLAPGDLGRSNR